MLVDYYWRLRVRHPLFTKIWLKAWAKRVLTASQLFSSCWRLARLSQGGARLESPCFLSPCKMIGRAKNLQIGANSFIGRVEIHLHAQVNIGRHVILNDGVRLLTGSHEVNDPSFRLTAEPIHIGDRAWIATGVIVLPGVTIGEGAVIGAGAVVAKDVPPYSVAVGNPAGLLSRERGRHLIYEPLHGLAVVKAWLGTTNPTTEAKGSSTGT